LPILLKAFCTGFWRKYSFENETYWVFPSYDKIAQIEVEELRNHQFTTRKAEYIIGIAKAMTTNEISKEALLNQHDFEKIKQSLMELRGVGAWSADYVLMKCFHDNSSYPVGDVGLQNAFKSNLGLDRKPTAEEMYEYAKAWKGWRLMLPFIYGGR
jgi:DNA-3-methyladenine glycosylase II (EC 3.2.2.21)